MEGRGGEGIWRTRDDFVGYFCCCTHYVFWGFFACMLETCVSLGKGWKWAITEFVFFFLGLGRI